jgi:hypothetical protein
MMYIEGRWGCEKKEKSKEGKNREKKVAPSFYKIERHYVHAQPDIQPPLLHDWPNSFLHIFFN